MSSTAIAAIIFFAGTMIGLLAGILYPRWRTWHIRTVRQGITFEEFKEEFADTDYAEAAIKMAFDDIAAYTGHGALFSRSLRALCQSL